MLDTLDPRFLLSIFMRRSPIVLLTAVLIFSGFAAAAAGPEEPARVQRSRSPQTGRGEAEMGPLEARLRALLTRAVKTAAATGGPDPAIDYIRLPVLIEGAWRPRFKSDQTGWEPRSYYLFAARWSVLAAEGNTVSFGSPPIVVAQQYRD